MLDFDGVIADLQGALITACNERFGTRFTVEDVTDWDWWSRQPKQFADFVWKECYGDTGWRHEVAPYDGVYDAVYALYERGEKAVIVTARTRPHDDGMRQWLGSYGLDFLDVIAIGRDAKSAYCQKLGLDTVIEDGAHNLRAMDPAKQTLFIVDRPWNRHEVLPGVMRVSGLPEAVEVTA